MNQTLIRWRKEDSIALSRAINTFNRNVRKLRRQEGSNLYLPDLVTYDKLRDDIKSRNEFNRVISSLREFSNKNEQELMETISGQPITKWEYNQITKARSRAIRNLTNEKIRLSSNINRMLMGDERIRQIESTIENLNNLENVKGYDFKRTMERALKLGAMDIELKQALVYRKNFMNALEEMSGYENYDMLISELNKIKNPIKFYEYVRQSETLSDLFIYYKDKATSQTYGGFASNQDAFNKGLQDLGISLDV